MSARLCSALLTAVTLVSLPVCGPGTLEATQTGQVLSRDREQQTLVVVITETPLMLLPDVDREPLRMLEVGTVLRFLDEDAGWFHTEYEDFHYGRRVGYVQRKDAVAVQVNERAATSALAAER